MKWTFIFLGMFFMLNCHGADDAKSASQEKLWRDIHPYAFYPLIGSGYSLADIEHAVVSMNIRKLMIGKKTNELSCAKGFARQEYWSTCYLKDQERDDDSYYAYFGFKYYKTLTVPGYSIVICVCNGGGSLTEHVFLLLKRNWKNYFDAGEVRKIEVITCVGVDNAVPSPQKIEEITKLLNQRKLGEASSLTNSRENGLLENVHPYAFFHLFCDTLLWGDKEKGIIGVNTTKLSINGHSNELADRKIFRINGGVGCINRAEELVTMIYFKLIRKLSTPNYYIVECKGNAKNRQSCIKYFLIKRSWINYYDWGEIKQIEVLTCEGDLGKSLPSSEEMARIDQLVREKKIGDIAD